MASQTVLERYCINAIVANWKMTCHVSAGCTWREVIVHVGKKLDDSAYKSCHSGDLACHWFCAGFCGTWLYRQHSHHPFLSSSFELSTTLRTCCFHYTHCAGKHSMPTHVLSHNAIVHRPHSLLAGPDVTAAGEALRFPAKRKHQSHTGRFTFALTSLMSRSPACARCIALLAARRAQNTAAQRAGALKRRARWRPCRACCRRWWAWPGSP